MKKIYFLFISTFLLIVILKNNVNFKQHFYEAVYEKNLSFAKINNFYQSHFGSPLPFSSYFDSIPVFNEKIEYEEANIYKNGVSLKVSYDYLIPSLDNGIVIFIGEKEGYGNTVIIQQENGIDVWYSNLKEIHLKLYDYIKKGTLIGSADELLYLVFIKDGEVMDYKKYI